MTQPICQAGICRLRRGKHLKHLEIGKHIWIFLYFGAPPPLLVILIFFRTHTFFAIPRHLKLSLQTFVKNIWHLWLHYAVNKKKRYTKKLHCVASENPKIPWKMVSLEPKKDDGANSEFFTAPESVQGFETVRQWLQKTCKKVSDYVP